MAEFGKGDPRWLVDDRVDGKNVNAWHWTERDCTKWFKQKLTKDIIGFGLASLGECKVTSVEKVDGEMTYCNRKGKDMFFYEMEIRLKWEADMEGKTVKGQVRIPSLCDEEPTESMEIRVVCDAKSKDGDILKTKIVAEGVPTIRETLQRLLAETKAHFKEPVHGGSGGSKTKTQHAEIVKEAKNEDKSFKTVSMKLSFDSSPELMYQCLMDDQRLSYFTQSAAQMERKVGGKFSIFGGQITGVNTALVENKEIEQDWRFESWPSNHYSKVKITLTQGKGTTELVLNQSEVPVSDFERTRSGWDQHFWSRIRAVFGFNYRKL